MNAFRDTRTRAVLGRFLEVHSDDITKARPRSPAAPRQADGSS